MLLHLKNNHQHTLTEVTWGVKLLYCLPAFVMVLMSRSIAFNLLVMMVFIGLSLQLTSLVIKELLLLYLVPMIFIGTTCITLVLSINSGHHLLRFGGYSIGYTGSGIRMALVSMSRSFGLITIVNFGLLTHSISEIAELMRRFRSPKVLIDLFVISYKFIENLMVSSKQLYVAQRCRLAYVNSGNKLHSFSMLVAAIFSRAIIQTKYLQISLDSRCFNDDYSFVRRRISFSKQHLFKPLLIQALLLIVFIISCKYGW